MRTTKSLDTQLIPRWSVTNIADPEHILRYGVRTHHARRRSGCPLSGVSLGRGTDRQCLKLAPAEVFGDAAIPSGYRGTYIVPARQPARVLVTPRRRRRVTAIAMQHLASPQSAI